MIDHVSIAVGDLSRARAFYAAVLGALGHGVLVVRATTIGFGKAYPEFWINLRAGAEGRASADGAHCGLRARDRAAVDAFHAAAIVAGGRCAGAPGLRPAHGEGYYAAFVRDGDGNLIEAATFLAAAGEGR
ncbi:MAG: VOC family protein [Proteobacteria bacterium]|nr:VOC family protein [Pseudomonadota bacterium]